MVSKKVLIPAVLVVLLVSTFNYGLAEEDGKSFELEDLKNQAPSVFLDCWRCDKNHIRTEITFVNYVRVREDADIHILVTEQRTGSGGREYTLEFIGQKRFEGMDNQVVYSSSGTNTWDESRILMVEGIKKGLFPYLMKTPLAEYLSVVFRQRLEPTAVDDPWNFWVFYISGNARFNGEESRNYRQIRGNFSANRVTPEWKFRTGVSGNFDESKFDYDGEHITSKADSRNLYSQLIKSLGDHWSAGAWVGYGRSTYSNKDSEYYLAPAVEYNFFPYYESTRRQLRCVYRVGLRYVRYIEETIYEKSSEWLPGQSLAVVLEVREPWGNASTELEGSHYFHDASQNRVQLEGNMNIRLVRGLSVSLRGEYSRIHDQLNLPKGDATIDEILLRRRELATNYEYSFSVGLSYTFGSIFSNVVNPRFGR
jgi:hypothetical protein